MICDSGRQIADIGGEGDVHLVFPQAMAESDEIVTIVRVESGSVLDGETFAGASFEEEAGMTVMAIRREVEWVIGPDA